MKIYNCLEKKSKASKAPQSMSKTSMEGEAAVKK